MTITQRTALPDPGMTIDPTNTALVVTDPQNDFLSPDGVTWGVVGKSVQANRTVEHIERSIGLAGDINNSLVFAFEPVVADVRGPRFMHHSG